jgi:hypothetical protein
MEAISCAQVRQLLLSNVQAGNLSEPAPELRAHLSTCPICRTALPLIAALDLSSVPEPISCDQCQADLAALIDVEREEGPGHALRLYPNVWWHLWTCATCLEAYDVTRALLDAEQRGELKLPAVAQSRPPERLIHLLRLTRQFLNLALPAPSMAVARGSGDGPLVISEGPAPGGARFVLSVESQRKGNWKIAVRVTPAPAGQLVLTLGAAVFRARFDPSGLAIVSDVPAALLTAVNGPDMVVDIAPDENSQRHAEQPE